MARRKVLVIAEVGTIGKMLSMIMQSVGYDVEVVDTSGCTAFRKAVKALSGKKYDLVVPTNNGMAASDLLAIIPEIKGGQFQKGTPEFRKR